MRMMLTKSCIGLIALALACVASAAEARDTGIIGGSGGGPFRDQCGAGQFLTGVFVNSGAWLDSLIPLCGKFNAATGLIGASGFPMGRHGGKGGSGNPPIACENNQYIKTMMFGVFTNTSSGAKHIATIQLDCAPIRSGGATGRPKVGPTAAPLEHGGFSCKDDEAVVGMIGRTSAYVDALGLICGPRPVVSSSPGGQKATSTNEQNVDRPGRDYKNFDLTARSDNADTCKSACLADGKCKAWTFVKAGVQGPKPRCWLKTSAPPPIPNKCCVSGVRN